MTNKYFDEIKSFVDKEVIVESVHDGDVKQHKGKLVAINFNYLSVVLETEDEGKVIIKHVYKIVGG